MHHTNTSAVRSVVSELQSLLRDILAWYCTLVRLVRTCKDGSTVRSDFACYVPRTLNRTVPAYRTSGQFLKRTVPVPLQKRRNVPAYRTVLPSLLLSLFVPGGGANLLPLSFFNIAPKLKKVLL